MELDRESENGSNGIEGIQDDNGRDSISDTGELTANGTIRRGRGRPPGSRNKPKDEVFNFLGTDESDIDYPTPKRRGRPRKDKGFTEQDLGLLLVGFFTIIALWRGEHWAKSEPELRPLTVPLAVWLRTLPTKVVANISHYLLPASIVVGLATILEQPIKVEMRYKEYVKSERLRRSSNNSNQTIGNNGGGNQQGTSSITELLKQDNAIGGESLSNNDIIFPKTYPE